MSAASRAGCGAAPKQAEAVTGPTKLPGRIKACCCLCPKLEAEPTLQDVLDCLMPNNGAAEAKYFLTKPMTSTTPRLNNEAHSQPSWPRHPWLSIMGAQGTGFFFFCILGYIIGRRYCEAGLSFLTEKVAWPKVLIY